jgi:SNF2 family DNA or RNA helicase
MTTNVIDVDYASCRHVPFAHQREGIEAIVANPFFALFDDMGIGKSKQTIDAAQVLFHRGIIDKVLVIAPAVIRSVWFDQELGELAKHLWTSTKATVSEYHARTRSWNWGPQDVTMRRMEWVITNYDFIRSSGRLDRLLVAANRRTLLVLDESSSIKNWTAQQTKACLKLRRKCGRVLLLNGTPIANKPVTC